MVSPEKKEDKREINSTGAVQISCWTLHLDILQQIARLSIRDCK